MNHKKSFPIINMGTSLLLVVFIVICLIVFATLSLSSSLRDQKYTDKAVLKTENYYLAYSHAQKQLKEIDQAKTLLKKSFFNLIKSFFKTKT